MDHGLMGWMDRLPLVSMASFENDSSGLGGEDEDRFARATNERWGREVAAFSQELEG